MENQTVRDLIISGLAASGRDGLYTDDCGCGIHDLAPCGEIGMGCRAARKSTCAKCSDSWWGPTVETLCGDCREGWGGDLPPVDKRLGY